MCKKHALEVTIGSATFSPEQVTFKVTLLRSGAESLPAQHYKLRQEMDGLPLLGTLIQIKNDLFTIVGLKSRARKNNILIERSDGKQFVTSKAVILIAKKLGKSPYTTGKGKK